LRGKPVLTPPKIAKIDSPILVVNSKTNIVGLPYLKESKSSADRVIGFTRNITSLKNQDKIAELLSAEEKMNKSAVLNVLRLSRV
jgi:hypothetical protein